MSYLYYIMSCASNCGKNGTIKCGLCKRVYCTKLCSISNSDEHEKDCMIDEELFRLDTFSIKHACSNLKCMNPARLRCGDCLACYYCSKECQSIDFSEHKKICSEEKEKSTEPQFRAFFKKYPRHARTLREAGLKSDDMFRCVVIFFDEKDQRMTHFMMMAFHSFIGSSVKELLPEKEKYEKILKAGRMLAAIRFKNSYSLGIVLP